MQIKLSTMDDVLKFIRTVSMFPGHVDIYQGRYIVNGKSYMGICSLVLNSPMDVVYVTTPEQGNSFDEFKEAIKEFAVQ